ncbi:MAG: hypothetical protein IPI77_19500 [Saprospiraceae bacterium]|nr:hypothetical protein [Saprospiraceae bacterium]
MASFIRSHCFRDAGTNTFANQPPNPFTLSSSPNTSQPVGSIFNLSTNPSDNDGTISKVEFYSGNSKIGESLIAPYTFDLRQYHLQATFFSQSFR